MKLSELLAANPDLDVDLELEEGDIVTDLMALVRIQRLSDTDDALVIGSSKHSGGIVQYGLVQAARLQIEDWMVHGDER